MAIKSGNWNNEWQSTLKAFEKANDASGKKRKIESKTKWWASGSQSDVGTAFTKLDRAYTTVDSANTTANMKAFIGAFKVAETSGAKYANVLTRLMEKNDKEGSKDKSLRSDYAKNISILKKDIKACLADASAALQDQANILKGDQSDQAKLQVLAKRTVAAVREAGVALAKTARKPDDAYAYNQILSKPLFNLSKSLDTLGNAAPDKGVKSQMAVFANTAKDMATPKLASFTGSSDADIKTARTGLKKQMSNVSAFLKSVARALKSV